VSASAARPEMFQTRWPSTVPMDDPAKRGPTPESETANPGGGARCERGRHHRQLRLTVTRDMLFVAVMLSLTWSYTVSAASEELHWYRGNTHTHTINSDGDSAPDTVVRWYREHGYQFLFLTDHEFVTDPAPLNALLGAKERFLVLPGQEITQWGEDPGRSSAHVNSLFTTQIIWPMGRRTCSGGGCGATVQASVPLAETFKINISAVLAAHGIPQINHPNYRWSVRPEDLYDVPDGCLFEVWNGQGHINNLGGTDDKGDTRPSAEGFWDILLSRGKVIWAVGSDDSHEFKPDADPHGAIPGQAWIMVHASELTSKAIETALRRGDFYASTGITLDDIVATSTEVAFRIVEKTNGASRYSTRFLGYHGKVLAEVTGTHPVYAIKGTEHYVHASVIDSNGNRAWTQPIFLDGRGLARAETK
jgi:hypothetical protein